MHKIVNVIFGITIGAIVGIIVLLGVLVGVVGFIEAILKRMGITALLLALLSPLALGQLVSQGNEQIITYSGATAFVLQNTPLNPNLLVTSGTNTFIMNVNPPSNAVRVYITNDTANACANLTISLAATGNTSLNSFNQTPGAWQSILLQNGAVSGFATTATPSLPASGTVYLTSAPVIGSKIALFIVLSSGCTTTNVDVQVVFGTFQTVSPNIQGVIPTGQNGTTENPVVCGGLDAANLVQPCGVYHNPINGVAAINGLALGAPGQSIATGFINVVMPNGSSGPMATAPYNMTGFQGSMFPGEQVNQAPYTSGLNCNTVGEACSGAYANDAGMMDTVNIPSSTSQAVFIGILPSRLTPVEFQTCRFDLNVASISGTGATLDVYIQDSPDNVNWTDRVHFPQITTAGGGQHSWVSIVASLGTSTINPYTTNTLAVNTALNGALGKYLRMSTIVTNTPVVNTGTISVNCK